MGRMKNTFAALIVAAVMLVGAAASARANPYDVGLGVAVGGAFSATKLHNLQLERTAGNSFSWGFFVDIPLLETFYISPAAMLYQLDVGQGELKPVTDIDLAFKFILPLSIVRLGVGFIVGLTDVAETYAAHVGALAHLGINLTSTFDVFVQFQYKRLFYSQQNLDDLHGYAGGMFRF